jgi:hypothetical protein
MEREMFRLVLVISALLPIVGGQTPATDTTPLEVTGYISPVDRQAWPGFTSEYGIFVTIRNTSGRGIRGYVWQMIVTDPDTGKPTSRTETMFQYQSPSLRGAPAPGSGGVLLVPSAETHLTKPYPVTLGGSGTLPHYSFNVDLVFFEDGTTWGPARSYAAKTWLAQIAAMAKIM